MKFEIIDLDVGGNFIKLKITNGDNQSELEFLEMPIDLINKTLNIYGVHLNKKEIEDYEF